MVDAAQNVLNAENEIGPGDSAGRLGWFDYELRALHGKALNLAATVEALDTRDDFGDTDRAPLDLEYLPRQSSGKTDRGPLDPVAPISDDSRSIDRFR